MMLSICTTNYNCGHVLERHLASTFDALAGLNFEYVIVDNHSSDASPGILAAWMSSHPNMTLVRKRCTMGEGRQIAFKKSRGQTIVVVDTDVVYNDLFRKFVDAYLVQCVGLSVQAIYCGIFPRDQWQASGGRRSLNTNEDVDLWIRIARFGTMRWYPVSLGENVKEAKAWGRSDHLSRRYSWPERILRLLRRQWDLWKTSEVERLDLDAFIAPNIIDLHLGPTPGRWPQSRFRYSRVERVFQFARELKRTLERT